MVMSAKKRKQKRVSRKIKKVLEEGFSNDQAVAIALNEERERTRKKRK